MRRRPRTEDDRSPVSFLQALSAALSAALLIACFAVLAKSDGHGWLRDFLLGAIPSAAVVAAAFAILHFLLEGRGLTRDQQLAAAIAAKLAATGGDRSPMSVGQTEPDWSALLDDADHLFAAARSLARWSTALDDELRTFFTGGGTVEVVLLDCDDAAQVQRAADDHAGHRGTRGLDRVRSNVVQGLRRVVLLADEHENGRDAALTVRVIQESSFAFASALFVLSRDGAPRRLVLRAHENARKGVTAGPVIVADLDDRAWRHFAATEVEGLRALSATLSSADVDTLAGLS
jgi:hypothetical protein